MTIYSLPIIDGTLVEVPTSKSWPLTGSYSVQRLATDPLYYADVEIINAVEGSGYILGWSDGGTFTEFTEDFSGVVPAGTSFTIATVPSYATPMLLELRLRKGTSGVTYFPFKISGYHNINGASIYCSQIEDVLNVNHV